MNWIRILISLWTGEAFKKETEENKRTVDEAKQVIEEARACLDGEDGWLRNPTERKLCDGKD